jgi:hypothetical protein
MKDPVTIENFLFAGKAVFTIRSAKTGQHYTYRVNKKKDSDIFFIALNLGYKEFVYLGYVKNRRFTTTAKSCRSATSKEVLAFKFLLKQISLVGDLRQDLEFFHEGTCGRCGRALTDPVSIELGLGPTCRKRS